MNNGLLAAGVALLWSTLCYFVDRSSSAGLSAIEEDLVEPNPWQVAVVAAVLGSVAGFIAPHGHALSAAVLVTAMANVAYTDWRHKLIWEEIAIPTIFAVLGAEVYAGNAVQSAEGLAAIGGAFCVLFFAASVLGKRTGPADLLPVATLGAAFGPLVGTAALGISAVSVILLYPFVRKTNRELPMGPGLVVGSIAGVMLEQFLPKT